MTDNVLETDRFQASDPRPQKVNLGQVFHARVRIYAPLGTKVDQIEEGLKYALGLGSCASDNPLVDGINGVVERVAATGKQAMALYDAEGENTKPGHRLGRVIEKTIGQPLSWRYE